MVRAHAVANEKDYVLKAVLLRNTLKIALNAGGKDKKRSVNHTQF